jgi:hypothetical protein
MSSSTRRHLLNAILFIAACAVFTRASGQFDIKNQTLSNPQSCIAQNQFIELAAQTVGTQTDAFGKTTVALGSYERISPDGRFVLRSFSAERLGEVSLIELPAPGSGGGSSSAPVKTYATPLKNEAFPVQGTWRYLVNINGDHYQFNSILNKQDKAKPLFRAGMTGFYAAASELPSSKADHVRIRSFSWPSALGSSDNQGEGALSVRTVEVDTRAQRVVADSGSRSICTERAFQDGPMYALPMISVDGEEFSALPQTPVQGQPTMRIYAFGTSGAGCEPRAAFAFSSGKTIFGYPTQAGQGADLAYEYKGQAWWYSRELGQAFNLAPYFEQQEKHVFIASAFPGITRDGRVIYGVTWKDCSSAPCKDRAGYVVADPYQSNAYQAFMRQYKSTDKGTARRQCITHADVARERDAFAKFHKLTP